jgi:hypothetical protein
MIHFTCDFCGQFIKPDDSRFEIRVEACTEAEWGAGPTPWLFREQVAAPEADPLAESELPAALDAFTLDLCAECYEAFIGEHAGRAAPMPYWRCEN